MILQTTFSPVLELQHQYNLLLKEYASEKEAYRETGRSYYNSLNQFVVEIERTEDKELEHAFEYGKPVCFFNSGIGGSLHYYNWSALISYVKDDRMVIVLPTKQVIKQCLLLYQQ